MWFYEGTLTGIGLIDQSKSLFQKKREDVFDKEQNDRFAQIVEDLNSSGETLSKVIYLKDKKGDKDSKEEKRFEMETGILNTLAVFENLLGINLGENDDTVDIIRGRIEAIKKTEERYSFLEKTVKKCFEKLFEILGCKVELSAIEGGTYYPDQKDYCDMVLRFKGTNENPFSFELFIQQGHHQVQKVKSHLSNQKKEVAPLPESEAYDVLGTSKDTYTKAFYELYETPFHDQQRLQLLIKKIADNFEIQTIQEFTPFIAQQAIGRVAWDDAQTAQLNFESLKSLIGKLDSKLSKELFWNIRRLDITKVNTGLDSALYHQMIKNLPESIEELSFNSITEGIDLSKFKKLKKLTMLNPPTALDGKILPQHLKYLKLSEGSCEEVTLEGLGLLEELYLESGTLKKIHLSKERLKKITIKKSSVDLNFSDLTSLEDVHLEDFMGNTVNLENTPSLKSLILIRCGIELEKNQQSVNFPHKNQCIEILGIEGQTMDKISINDSGVDLKFPKSVREISVKNSRVNLDLEHVKNLDDLSIGGYEGQIVKYPLSLKKLYIYRAPETLNLEGIKGLESVHIQSGNLHNLSLPKSLKDIDLSMVLIEELKLKDMDLDNVDISTCEKLTKVTPPLSLKNLRMRTVSVKDLFLGEVKGLEKVDIANCKELSNLTPPLSLKDLVIKDTSLQKLDLTLVQGLENLNINDCEKLKNPTFPLSLKKLNIGNIPIEGLDLEHVNGLEYLSIFKCTGFNQYKLPLSLQSIIIKQCPFKNYDFKDFKNLKRLTLEKVVSNTLTTPASLEMLELRDCRIVDLNLKKTSIDILSLDGAIKIQSFAFPSALYSIELSNSISIETLNLTGQDVGAEHMIPHFKVNKINLWRIPSAESYLWDLLAPENISRFSGNKKEIHTYPLSEEEKVLFESKNIELIENLKEKDEANYIAPHVPAQNE